MRAGTPLMTVKGHEDAFPPSWANVGYVIGKQTSHARVGVSEMRRMRPLRSGRSRLSNRPADAYGGSVENSAPNNAINAWATQTLKYPGCPMSAIRPLPVGVQPSRCWVRALDARRSKPTNIAKGP
jgi:hypothetical protein